MKIQVSNPVLRSLLDSLGQGSKEVQQKSLQSAEKLMQQIDLSRDYPLDFVVFRLTGSRPRVDMFGQAISGRQLLNDLRVWLNRMSSPLALPAHQQSEPIYTVVQIAERYSVSTKTVHRWQKRGLVGRAYLFPDGKKRLGFTALSVDQFEAKNTQLVKQAREFSLLSKAEKKGIVAAFEEIASHNSDLTRNQILRKLVFQTGRSREAIRYIVSDYEQTSERTLGLPARQRLTTKDAATIFSLYCSGVRVGVLSRQFGRTASAIHRTVIQRWTKEMLNKKYEFIPSLEFESTDAERTILGEAINFSELKTAGAFLSRPAEQMLFRRYNYLKYLGERLRKSLLGGQTKIRTLKKIEFLMAEADKIKHYLVEANMALVAGIASKHLKAGSAMSELVSEGAISMMRAVEKFDYARGYRFSTYAGWVIAKDFARKIPEEAARLDRMTASDMSEVSEDMRSELLADAGVVEKASRDLRQIIENTLDEREKYVVLNHFALDAGVIKKKPKTLKQIGDDLGFSKERVRQIELQALQKLRHSLSPEQFDLLTG